MAITPQVIYISPKNYDIDVPTNTSITAEFNTDIDNDSLKDHVYLTNTQGVSIEGRITYRRKKLIFTPLEPLQSGTTYQFFIIGDSNLNDDMQSGVKSILGIAMAGNVSVQFTTDGLVAIKEPTPLNPASNSIIRQVPTFEWSAVENAVSYEIMISKTNNYDTLVFPTGVESAIVFNTSIEPNIEFEDGIYYWRVRAIREDGVKSNWSTSYQFNLDTTVQGTISEEDAQPVDIMYDEVDQDLELVQVFPDTGSIDIPTNVKSIYFRVIGDIDVSLIDVDSFKVIGKHISGDMDEESHGEVKGNFTIVNHHDGTTYLIFTPEPLPTIG